jgi:lysophospholipase L1-like esterase
MSFSDTAAAKKYAAIAEVAAGEAKSFAEDARQAENFSIEAKASADDASRSAQDADIFRGQAEESAANAAESKISAEDSAESAAASAQIAQNISDANTYYTTPEDPNGTIAGLAGTPSGDMFRVALGPGSGFKYYLNSSGTAIEKASTPGDDVVLQLKYRVKEIPLILNSETTYPVVCKNGGAPLFIDKNKIGGIGLNDALHGDIKTRLGNTLLGSQGGTLTSELIWPAFVKNKSTYAWFNDKTLYLYDIALTNPNAFNLSQAKSFAPLITNGKYLYRWRAARATLDVGTNTRKKALCIGDSYMDFSTIPQIIANWMYGLYGKSADGWASVCGPVSGRVMYLNSMSFSFSGFTPWSIGGPDTEVPPYGCGIDGYCIYTSGSTATATLSGFDGTRITIYYRDSGSFRYRIDGGTWTTVTTSGTGAQSKTEITGLSAGTHSIDIDTTVNTGVVALHGFYVKNWNKPGIELHKCGHAGARGIQYLNKISPHIQYYAQEINPDLVFIILGTNDYRNATSNVTNFIAGVDSIVQAFRAASSDVGIVFIAPPDTNGVPANSATPLTVFVNAARVYAVANGIEFVDINAIMSTWAEENLLGQFVDDLHLNDAGATGLLNTMKDKLI